MQISIHAPLRGATADSRGVALCAVISIHAPPRGATVESKKFFIAFAFQFTPLREGRRFRVERRHSWVNISIHAPPRGATSRLPKGS